MRERLFVAIAGATVSAFYLLRSSPSLGNLAPTVLSAPMAEGAFVWVLLYEFLFRFRHLLRSGTLLQAIFAVWLIKTPVSILISLGFMTLSGTAPGIMSEYYGKPENWVRHITGMPATWQTLLTAGLLVLLSFYLIRRRGDPLAGGQASTTTWTGYGGVPMDSKVSQTTRFLCASVFLGGIGYCDRVLRYLKDQNRAIAPEAGVDVALVSQVCTFAAGREVRYHFLFLAFTILSYLGWVATESPLVVFAYILATIGTYGRKTFQERFSFAKIFNKDIFDPAATRKNFPSDLGGEIEDSLPSDDQNLVVYSGFVPFVGAGIDLRRVVFHGGNRQA